MSNFILISFLSLRLTDSLILRGPYLLPNTLSLLFLKLLIIVSFTPDSTRSWVTRISFSQNKFIERNNFLFHSDKETRNDLFSFLIPVFEMMVSLSDVRDLLLGLGVDSSVKFLQIPLLSLLPLVSAKHSLRFFFSWILGHWGLSYYFRCGVVSMDWVLNLPVQSVVLKNSCVQLM